MKKRTFTLRMLLPMLLVIVFMILSLVTLADRSSGNGNLHQLFMALTGLSYALAASAPEAEKYPAIRRMLPISALLGTAMLMVFLRARFLPGVGEEADNVLMICVIGLSFGLLMRRR